MQQPRQMYGLGSLVKSITKGVKSAVKGVTKAAKSPLGLAAMASFIPFGASSQSLLQRATPFLFGKQAYPMQNVEGSPGIFGAVKNFFGGEKTLGKTLAMGALGTTAAAALQAAGLDTENPNEMPRDVESLKSYLRTGYMQLNPKAEPEEVDQFVTANTAEYATGGRVGFDEGGYTFEQFKKDKFKVDQFMGEEQMKRLYEKMMREKKVREQRNMAAYGGRVGYAEGTEEGIKTLIIPKKPKFQTEEEVNATTLGRAEIGDPLPGREESGIVLGNLIKMYENFKKSAKEMSNPEEAMALFNQRVKEEYENLHFLDKEKFEDYVMNDKKEQKENRTDFKGGGNNYWKMVTEMFVKSGSEKGTGMNITEFANEYFPRKDAAYGGRMMYARGSDEIVDQASGIMNLPQRTNAAGVKELDLRDSGGFIPPVGVKEKADDIPAMLSNNEFVFTADAVRGMGGGDVNKGAQRMYDMMKKLEKGGRV